MSDTLCEDSDPHEPSTILEIENFSDDFFMPHVPIPKEQWRSRLFLKLWKRCMMKCPSSSFSHYYWVPFLAHTLTPCTAKDALYASRIAASFVAWLGRNNGFGFAETLFKETKNVESFDDDYHNAKSAIMLWGFENSLFRHLNLGGGRTLHKILGQRTNVALKAIEFDTVEKVVVWLSSKDGIAYLTKTLAISKRIERGNLKRSLQIST
jgi:hypothetical protein